MGNTPLETHIGDLIRTGGPLSFAQFMECALYHPEFGYYRSGREVFGRGGDFFTAEQLQPVFGELLHDFIDDLARSSGISPFDVVELGAGRADLASALQCWNYRAIDFAQSDFRNPQLPTALSGLILAHEFFDALPVRLLKRNGESWLELAVSLDDSDKFCFLPVDASRELMEYARAFGDVIPEGGVLEVNEGIPYWCRQIACSLSSGFLLVFDYGYEPRELLRFPAGSLLSYHHHRATANVLDRPGEQDITAHVNFAHLTNVMKDLEFEFIGKKTLRAWALSVWPEESFARRWQRASNEWRLQWKQLAFGMGESFHVLLFRKVLPQEPQPLGLLIGK